MIARIQKELKKNYLVYIVLIPIFIHFLIFQIIPFVFALFISFFKWDYINTPIFIGLENWTRAFHDTLFLKSMTNTLLFTLYFVGPVIALGLILALIIGSKINKLAFVRGIYFLPVVTSFVVLSAIWRWMFSSGDYGIINNILDKIGIPVQPFFISETQSLQVLALLSIFKCAGTIMVYYFAALKNVPSSLYEASTVDGAGALRQFFHITLPLIKPTTMFVLILATTSSFQIFDSAYLITSGGPNNATQTMVYQIYQNAFTGFNGGYASAQSYILFIIILLISLIQRKVSSDESYI